MQSAKHSFSMCLYWLKSLGSLWACISEELVLFFSLYKVCIPLHRDGTDGQATVYWSLKPSGFNSKAVTLDDIGPFNGSVVFLSGQSDTTINITVKADDIPEMNETVTLSLDR